MIPAAYITEWRKQAPWPESYQVEQDLVISRALVEIYSDPDLKNVFAFRGGTSLQKIFFPEPKRYSEDIDLVQVPKENIGSSIDKIRRRLDPWLGTPKSDRGDSRYTLKYRFESEESPVRKMRLKIEINTGEHICVLGAKEVTYRVQSTWFSGQAQILTYEIVEILGTKMRALFQRKKGRDLFDMDMSYQHFPNLDDAKTIACFQAYLKHEGLAVSRAEYEKNLHEKLGDNAFIEDIRPLLKSGASQYDVQKAGATFKSRTLSKLPGEPWKGLKPGLIAAQRST
jgi:predicted nucleotidyltransferase component of viral defense system